MVALRFDELPEFLTMREAQAILRVGRSTIYELAHRGELRTVRLGRRLLVPRAAIVEMATGATHEEV